MWYTENNKLKFREEFLWKRNLITIFQNYRDILILKSDKREFGVASKYTISWGENENEKNKIT